METKTITNKPIVFYMGSLLDNLLYGIIMPLFLVYLLSINLNLGQIGILFATERISALIFEIPTGGFADKYGRKKSILVSFLMLSLVFLIWFFTKNFFILLGLCILWGLSHTFQSGAEESLIIDSLELAKNDDKRNKVFSRISIFNNLGFLIGGLIGAFLAFYFLKFIWLTACILGLMIFFLYLFFTEDKYFKPQFQKEKNPLKGLIGLIKDNVSFVLKNNIVSIFLLITFIWSLSFSFYGFGYPVMLKKILDVPLFWFGLLGSFSALIGIIGAWFGEKITKKFGSIPGLSVFSAILLFSLVFFGISKTFILILIIFAIIELTNGAWSPIYLSFLNKFIPSEKRASLLSLNSTVSALALAIGELMAGFLLNFLYPGNILILAGILFVFIPLFLFQIKKLQTIKKS